MTSSSFASDTSVTNNYVTLLQRHLVGQRDAFPHLLMPCNGTRIQQIMHTNIESFNTPSVQTMKFRVLSLHLITPHKTHLCSSSLINGTVYYRFEHASLVSERVSDLEEPL